MSLLDTKHYKVRNTKQGVELLRLYPGDRGLGVIQSEGFDNHRLLNGTVVAIVDGEIKVKHPNLKKEGIDNGNTN